MTRVTVRNLSKSFNALEVLHNIDISAEEGDFVVLVGPSGCGKTTLLRIIAGLEEATRGEIRFGDRDVTDISPAKRGAAMVFQSYALYPHKNVAENMGFGLKMSGHSRKMADARVNEVAQTLQLGHLLERKPRELSGGQRQRVAIGRAISRQPDVFLFDEPLSNLDAALRVEMRLELARLHKHLGATMIYVTHDQVEAMTLATKIVVMNDGRIEQIGTPNELYRRPANKFVAGFLGMPQMNFLKIVERSGASAQDNSCFIEGQVDRGEPLYFDSAQPDVAARAAEIGIRPENLRLGQARPGEISLAATILHSEFLGAMQAVYLEVTANESGQRLVCMAEPEAELQTGTKATVSFHPRNCRLFDENGDALTTSLQHSVAEHA